jgi:quercetin dioxygenase-like cupin family protein
MKVLHYLDAKPIEEVPGAVMRRVICQEQGAPNFCMRVFEVAPGMKTPSHFHPWEHEVYILSGQGKVVGIAGEKKLGQDTALFIAPNEKHFLEATGKTPLRFICVIPNIPEEKTSGATACRFQPQDI